MPRWLIPVLLAFQLVGRVVDRPTGAFELVLTLGLVVLLILSVVALLRSRALDRTRWPTDLAE